MAELSNILSILSYILIISFKAGSVGTEDTQNAAANAMSFLAKYGWIDKEEATEQRNSPGNFYKQIDLREAVQDFQSFYHLNVTGNLDNDTLNFMKRPRCGVPDKLPNKSINRQKRYALIPGPPWQKTTLTYKLTHYIARRPTFLEINHELQKAFKFWEDGANIAFKDSDTNPPDIEIRFERGNHGDNDPFDGPGRIIAHAQGPGGGGDIHFDDDEEWRVPDGPEGYSVFQAGVHEIGHSLGLGHSNDPEAIMFGVYRYREDFKLHKDDLEGIEELYGKKGVTTTDNRGISPPAQPDIKPRVRPTAAFSPSPNPCDCETGLDLFVPLMLVEGGFESCRRTETIDEIPSEIVPLLEIPSGEC